MKIKGKEWINVWAGTWSFLSCTDFADAYSKKVRINGKAPFPDTLIFFEDGKSSCWVPLEDKDKVGKLVVKSFAGSQKSVADLCDGFHKKVDEFLAFTNDRKNWGIKYGNYRKLWDLIVDEYAYHIAVKYIVDYLSEEKLKKYLSNLEKARVYAEPVFKISEDFARHFIKEISKKSGIEARLVSCLNRNELESYFKSGKLPSKNVFSERYGYSVIIADKKSQRIKIGGEAKRIHKQVSEVKPTNSIYGQIAFKGKVKGTVRVIFDPSKREIFNSGDILVTGMTRPEFLPLMEKSAAIVTDAGGILSHAAITARELKKPCIIGTKIATKVLKDGDLVEVNADIGVVKILKKAK